MNAISVENTRARAVQALEEILKDLQAGRVTIGNYNDKILDALIKYCNLRYREGNPVVPDTFYDCVLIAELQSRDPQAEFLQEVEPEPELIEGKTVTLPVRMLSTDKAYSLDAIEKWVERVMKAALYLGIAEDEVLFKMTPKLDGFAAYDDGKRLYTRGDGYKGTDISHVFERGLKVYDDRSRGAGPGEIVVGKAYFASRLASEFENSRNFISTVIKEGEWSEEVKKAVEIGAVVFCPFSLLLPYHLGFADDLLVDFDKCKLELLTDSGFDVDGVVIECIHQDIKDHLGHTNHHHRWQIAFKENTEYHDIEVTDVIGQTAKTGRITPVAILKPTKVSGVTITRATGHHYGNIMNQGIGPGAIVRVCRSGLVIPKIEKVIKHAPASWPDNCPSCGAPTYIDGDNLFCSNTIDCPAQIERTIEYFFKTLGNCDGFGPKVIEQLVSKGFDTVLKIYAMSLNDFMVTCGFGEKTSWNLFEELGASQRRPIEDWRFLAAFGINNVGKGGCERLLKHHRLEEVFLLTVDQIEAIDGFGVKTANILADALTRIYPDFNALFKLGFNLIKTPLLSEAKAILSPINEKTVVFTGSMKTGSREELQKQAKLLGAKVGSSVSSKTDYLVCGANVGASKINDAAKHGVIILSEDEYLEKIGS